LEKYITVNGANGIATITINRADKRNAIGYCGWLELRSIVSNLSEDEHCKVVIFTGAGDQAFSAGADINDFGLYRNNKANAKTYAAAFEGALDAIESLTQPTICLIKGYCIGGGCELTMATDLRIAADNSHFGIPAAKLSVLIGFKEMRRLVNLVGQGNASYVLLSARQIPVTEAEQMGLVNKILPLAEIDEYTYSLAREIAALAPLSHRGHKKLLQTVLNANVSHLSEADEDLIFSNFSSEDFQEGRTAFIEHRLPQFKGR
jgi:enoyl-CoA hydratase/carnithine racemase